MKRIDTLAQYEKFISSGFSPEQAKAQVQALTDAQEIDFDVVATKEDVRHLELKIDYKFKYVFVLVGIMFAVVVLPVLNHLFNYATTAICK